MSLTEIYNRSIQSVKWYRRQGQWSGVEGKGFHDGLMITDDENDKWLLHITTGCKKAVLVNAQAMSSKWSSSDNDSPPENDLTIGELMGPCERRGPYNVATNNCVQLLWFALEVLGLTPDLESSS
jgi:hypothetical protein